MADPQGLFVFPGINQIISGSMTLTHGITPSHAQIVCAPQNTVPTQVGPLAITYGSQTIAFSDCFLDSQTFDYDAGGYIWRMTIYDRRWRWRNTYVNGSYNLRWPDGSLNTVTEQSPAELLKLCFAALNESKYDISAIGPVNWVRPETHWDHDNAAQALQEIAETLGCRVVLGADDIFHICPAGIGATLPGGSIEAISQSKLIPRKPEILLFVGGPSRYQINTWLEAVGLDVDGLVKPLDELSYAPDKFGQPDWTKTEASFAVLDNLAAQGKVSTRARKCAQESVYRWYRIREAPLGVTGIQAAENGLAAIDGTPDDKIAKPLMVPGYDQPILSRLQILPIEDEMVETSIDFNAIQPRPVGAPEPLPAPKNKPALVWGQYDLGKDDKSLNIKVGADLFKNLFPFSDIKDTKGRGAEVNVPFGIDRHEGIVRFSRQIYRLLQLNNNAIILNAQNVQLPSWRIYPAHLALRVATTVRDTNTRTPLRYEKIMPLDKAGSGAAVVRKEFVIASYYEELSTDNTAKPAISNIQTSFVPNVPPVQDEAQYYLDAAAKGYQVGYPQEGTWAGIVPISPDGAIQSVNWSTSEAGAVTKASSNCELVNVPRPYREKLKDSKLWEDRLGMFQEAAKLARLLGGDKQARKIAGIG